MRPNTHNYNNADIDISTKRGALTSSALHSFSVHRVLRSCKSTSGTIGRDLALLWLRRDVRVGGL